MENIGIGNFGRVVKAFNESENRWCALKILQKDTIRQMKHVEHVIYERENLMYLSDKHHREECPYIVRLFSAFQDEENLYFELEYIEGCTLLDLKLNPTIAKHMDFYASEVILTLEYLHQNNIIYRDLKLENVMVSAKTEGHIKLVDFGFSKKMTPGNLRTTTNCGTPAYVAPEIVHGYGHSFEVDVWSLGILMAEIVSQQTPFQADSTK